MKPILHQLVDYYYSDQSNDSAQSCKEEIEEYFKVLLEGNNIVYELDEDGELKALMEFFLVNEDQAKRLQSKEAFEPRVEDVKSGSICYINDIWIDIRHRNNGGFKIIKTLQTKAEEIHGKKATKIMGLNSHNRRLNGKFKIFNGV